MTTKNITDDKKKFYYEIKQSTRAKWELYRGGFFAESKSVWNCIIRNKKLHQDFEKRILVRENKEIVRTIPVTVERIRFYIKNLNKIPKNFIGSSSHIPDAKHVYIFEVKLSTETKPGAFVMRWENPLTTSFPTGQAAWKYIIRNQIKFNKLPKKIITLEIATGKIVHELSFNENFIEVMKTSTLIRGEQ